ncbi:MAG: hypothetical protein NC827_08295 [Candidatus Omnitrophica bacterium]|nr:hypothetical protein [Candidatus Omnitrophota bacterium]MCM8803289.1 hypothetical protein [Candidatus Omnitrophota bacterium]
MERVYRKRMEIKKYLMIFAFLFCFSLKGDEVFKHRYEEIEYNVDKNGISLILIDNKKIAEGFLGFIDVSKIFNIEGPIINETECVKNIEILSEKKVKVNHLYPNLKLEFYYIFEKEDVKIDIKLENLSAEKEIPIVAFGGLKFYFSKNPEGIIFSHDPGYINANGKIEDFCHPSHFVRIGGAYLKDENFGFGLSPYYKGFKKTLFYGWINSKGSERSFTYIVPERIAPEETKKYSFILRVSKNTDWKYLLSPYKEFFKSNFGDIQYNHNFKIWSQFCSGDFYHSSIFNPYGFNGPSRRIDLEEGAKLFCEMVIPGLKNANGQGIILWAISGFEPRGAMFRSDFDIFPPEIEKNIPYIIKKFNEAGLKIGLATRPRHITYRVNWRYDGVIDINPNDIEHLNMLYRRFKKTIDMGFSAFYLDSFGNKLEDVIVMKFLREKIGPDIPTFSEHHCDILLIYSGIYAEIGFDFKNKKYSLPTYWEVYKYLVGEIDSFVILRFDKNQIPKDVENPFEFLFKNNLTPAIPDYLIGSYSEELKIIGEKYIDEKGKWKGGK